MSDNHSSARSAMLRRGFPRSRSVIAGLILGLASATVTATTITFTDDFNRPDGVVGNGWLPWTGGASGDLVIQNGALTAPDPFMVSGIYRPVDYSAPVTISGTFTQTNGYPGPSRYESGFLLGTTGALSSGYEVLFHRSDSTSSNSSVSLYMNGAPFYSATSTLLSKQYSPFQFESLITPTVTYSSGEGRIFGSVTGRGNTFNFDFSAVQNIAIGSNIGIQLESGAAGGGGSNATFIRTTFDNVSITYTETPPPPPPPKIADGSYGVFSPDIPSSFPNYTPTSFGQGIGGALYDLDVINGNVVVGIEIGLVGDTVGDLIKSIWKAGIESAWSNKYEIMDDDLNRYPITFDVRYSEGLFAPFADWVVNVHDEEANRRGSWWNTDNWYTSTQYYTDCINNETIGAIAAHEFGHFLGLYDEYAGGKIGPFGVREGEDAGSMGPCPTMPVQERYFEALLANFIDEFGQNLILAPAPGFSPIGEMPPDAYFPPEAWESTQVPEPSTLFLMGAVFAYFVYRSRRRAS